jgi:hypothetical protein
MGQSQIVQTATGWNSRRIPASYGFDCGPEVARRRLHSLIVTECATPSRLVSAHSYRPRRNGGGAVEPQQLPRRRVASFARIAPLADGFCTFGFGCTFLGRVLLGLAFNATIKRRDPAVRVRSIFVRHLSMTRSFFQTRIATTITNMPMANDAYSGQETT